MYPPTLASGPNAMVWWMDPSPGSLDPPALPGQAVLASTMCGSPPSPAPVRQASGGEGGSRVSGGLLALSLTFTFIRVVSTSAHTFCLTSEETLQVGDHVRCHVRLHLQFAAHSFLCPCSSSLFGEFSYDSPFRFGVVLTRAWEKGFLCFASLCGFFSIQCTQL